MSASDVQQEEQQEEAKEDQQIGESSSEKGDSNLHKRNAQNDKTIDDDEDESGEEKHTQQQEQQRQDDHSVYERQKSISDKRNIVNGLDNLHKAPGIFVRPASSTEQVEESASHQDDTDSSINNNDLTDETSYSHRSHAPGDAVHLAKEEEEENEEEERVNNINRITGRTDKMKESHLADKTRHIHQPASSTAAAAPVTRVKVSTLNSLRSNLMDNDYDGRTVNSDWQGEQEEKELTERRGSQETVNNVMQDAPRKGNNLMADKIDRNLWFLRPSVRHHQHHHRHATAHVDSVDLRRKSQVSREKAFSRHSEQLRKRRKSNGETDTLKDEQEEGEERMQVATKYIGETKWKGKEKAKEGGESEGGDLNEWKGQRDKRTLLASSSSSSSSSSSFSSHSGQENEEMQSSGAFDALNDAHQVHLSPSRDTPFSSHALCDMKKARRNRVTSNAEDESEDDTDTHTDEETQMKQEDEESQVFSSNISDDDVNTVSSGIPPSPWMNTGQSTSSNSDGTLTLQYVHFLHFHQVASNHRALCASFNEPVIFQLQASIPGTDFVVKKSVEYTLPSKAEEVAHSTAAAAAKKRHHQFTR